MSELVDALYKTYMAALANARAAEKAWEQAVIDEYPMKVGDIIASKSGVEAKVVRLVIRYGKVTPIAELRKKDGKFGKKEAPMWHSDWKLPVIVSRAGASHD